MEPNQAMKWNKKASIVYAMGAWTIVGSYFYFKYTGKYDDVLSAQKGKTEEAEDVNKKVVQTAHCKTVIIYKKDFVPYSTRFFNFIYLFRGEPGKGDSGK